MFIFFFQITSEGLDEVLVLEDDARFEPYFRFKLQMVLNELKRLKVSWDLVYVKFIRRIWKVTPYANDDF